MASLFLDWDGTVARFGTNTPNRFAMEHLRHFLDLGHQVFLTTARTDVTGVKRALKRARLEDVVVIPGVQNPRVVINDMGAYAVNHPQDSAWNYWELGELPVQPIA